MVSENVEKIKVFLKDGYKISSINFSLENANTEEQIERVEIKLVKGKNEEVVFAENDSEFTLFSFHFKKFDDGYGNPVFLYVEDLDKYNKEIKEQLQFGEPPKKDYEISIGSRKLIEPSLYYLMQPGPGQPFGKSTFTISISKNIRFKNFDYRDEILIKELDSGKIVFNGYIFNIIYGDDIAMFLCQGGPKNLHIQKISLALMNFQDVEALNFISESAGLTPNFPSGKGPNFTKRPFTIICPILNFKIPNSFSIGDVIFYNSEKSEDDEIIENNDYGKKDERWNIKNVRAKTIIEAKSFFEAIQIGYSKISRTVDFIRLRIDLSSPYQTNDNLNPLSFNFQKQYSRFDLTTQIYCRENSSRSAMIYDINVLIGHPLIFIYDPEEYIGSFFERFKNILSKPPQDLTKKESRIASSLHWLSLAINNNDQLDKLLYLWNSLEFLISESKTEKKFDKNITKLIKNKIKELSLTEEQLGIVDESIQQLNNAPLMVKLKTELNKNNIELDENELKTLKKLRKLRNDVIHGKAIVKINDADIEKFISIIERLLISII